MSENTGGMVVLYRHLGDLQVAYNKVLVAVDQQVAADDLMIRIDTGEDA